MTTPTDSWDSSYTGDTPAPWDIGRPQLRFRRLADQGLLTGQLLNAGCGTGEHALLAAASGAQVTGVDIATTAIGRARAKAAERSLRVRFEVASALNLADLGATFDTVLDSGLFHVFGDDNRDRYVASLGSVLRPGGSLYLMCFSELQPGDVGPRRVTQDELRGAFADGWTVEDIVADAFTVHREFYPEGEAQSWFATIRRQ